MNLSMQIAVLVAAVCLCLAEASPELRLVRKQQRPTRGFRPGDLMTARGFGKRDSPPSRAERDVMDSDLMERTIREFRPDDRLGTARAFGKRLVTPIRQQKRAVMESDSMGCTSGEFRPDNRLETARAFRKRLTTSLRGKQQQEQIGYAAPIRREFNPRSKLLVAQDFGKRSDDEVYGIDNFWETLESSPEREGQDGQKTFDSIPVDWFVNEMLNNPDFARSVVRKFIDVNQDGLLSADELLRNVV